MKHIAKAFEKYKQDVIPKNASKTQLEQTEYAFFAGAMMLLHLLHNGFNKTEKEATVEDENLMKEIKSEITEYVENLIRNEK